MKKVIVISTSLRAGSNSDMLADEFMEGALQAGHEVEKNLTHRKRYTFLPRVPGLPETGQVCDSGRCRCHHADFALYNNTQIYQFCSLSYKEKLP